MNNYKNCANTAAILARETGHYSLIREMLWPMLTYQMHNCGQILRPMLTYQRSTGANVHLLKKYCGKLSLLNKVHWPILTYQRNTLANG